MGVGGGREGFWGPQSPAAPVTLPQGERVAAGTRGERGTAAAPRARWLCRRWHRWHQEGTWGRRQGRPRGQSGGGQCGVPPTLPMVRGSGPALRTPLRLLHVSSSDLGQEEPCCAPSSRARLWGPRAPIPQLLGMQGGGLTLFWGPRGAKRGAVVALHTWGLPHTHTHACVGVCVRCPLPSRPLSQLGFQLLVRGVNNSAG